MSAFTGQYEVTGLDAITVLVRLSNMDRLNTRCRYLRRVTGASVGPQNMDHCGSCMLRSFGMIVGADDNPDFILKSMAKGMTVVVSIEPYKEGEVCMRCAEHRSLISFTDRLLGVAK